MEQAEKFAASLTAEGRYRLLVDSIADYAVYMLDPSGIISSWNTGARRFKGYEADEILGQHFSVFYTDEDRATNLPARALHQAETTGKFEAEGWRVRKNGTRFWAYVVIDPIRDDLGNLVGFAKITRDLTERKEAERALEVAREALFQSQKTEAIGRLTGGIAHDFNNLLMVVLGSLELLRKRIPDDPKLIGLVDNAMEGAQRGATLTQRMLSFARRQQLNLEYVDVRGMVRGMSDLLQRSLGHEVVIETRFPLTLPPVRTDINQLEAALLNLALNARDSMKDTTGQIIISAREEYIGPNGPAGLHPGLYVCLSVQDNGTGMDAETLSRATEPFFTTKGPGKGTGLGLSMVHGLATQSGGHLELKSEHGVGTIAEIWFPAMAAEVKNPDEAPKPAAPPAVKPLEILVVDDDALVLTNTVAMLEDAGHTVFTAASGPAGLEILRRRKDVDLIITDQAMPGMTGAQLVEEIRSKYPGKPIILATGYAELPQGLANTLPTLQKPFSQAQLAEIIAKVMYGNKIKEKA